MNYTLRLDQPSERVTAILTESLQQQGLQATASFDSGEYRVRADVSPDEQPVWLVSGSIRDER